MSPEASSGRSVRSWSETISSSTFTGDPVLVGAAGGRGTGVGTADRDDRRRSIARGVRRTDVSRGPRRAASSSVERAWTPRGSSRDSRAGPAAGRASAAATRAAASAGRRRGRRWRGSAARPGRANDGGRVYCGYSRSPSANDSSAVDAASIAPGQQADDGVDDDERRQLAAGQHVVADRQLEIDQRPNPLVDALVARADEDEVGLAGEFVGPRLAERRRRPGSRRITVESGRRSASSAAATGSGRMTIPAPPPYGASSTLRCRPIPQSRRSWTRIVARPRSWMRPGMLAASGPSTIAGKSVRTRSRGVTVEALRVGSAARRAGRRSGAGSRRPASG